MIQPAKVISKNCHGWSVLMVADANRHGTWVTNDSDQPGYEPFELLDTTGKASCLLLWAKWKCSNIAHFRVLLTKLYDFISC